jgi:hypothetical protein
VNDRSAPIEGTPDSLIRPLLFQRFDEPANTSLLFGGGLSRRLTRLEDNLDSRVRKWVCSSSRAAARRDARGTFAFARCHVESIYSIRFGWQAGRFRRNTMGRLAVRIICS